MKVFSILLIYDLSMVLLSVRKLFLKAENLHVYFVRFMVLCFAIVATGVVSCSKQLLPGKTRLKYSSITNGQHEVLHVFQRLSTGCVLLPLSITRSLMKHFVM